jgi:hypothetical protein
MLLRTIAYILVTVACYGQCPLQFIKVDPVVKEGWNRVGRAMASSDQGRNMAPDFVVKVRNLTDKPIRGLKVQAAYFDATEDLAVIPVEWNWHHRIKAREEQSMSWPNELYTDRANIGWLVIPTKILFEDGSVWEAVSDNVSDCYGEYWRDKKHPRLTKLPTEILPSRRDK